QDTKEKVRDIFKIDLLTPPDSGGPNVEHILNPMRFNLLLLDFNKLRAGFNRKFPIVCEPQGVLAAFVSNNFRDETVHVVTPRYFALNEDRRAVTLVHERAHTVLRAAGHPGTGDVPACIEPHKGFPGLTYDEAVKNAWCYEWLTASLQSNYTPGRFADLGGCHLAGRAS
ncbi:unnamed protein product, partial [marine sediment metagenome]